MQKRGALAFRQGSGYGAQAIRLKTMSSSSPNHRHFIGALCTLLVLGALGLGGCVMVQPYERERLARPDMQMGGSPDARSGEDHSRASNRTGAAT